MKCLLKYRTLLTPSVFERIWRFQRLHLASIRMSDTSKDKVAINPQLLEILACPLSKKPLRYDKVNNELVCDDIGVAYPIVDGIPILNPVDGRLLKGGQSQGS